MADGTVVSIPRQNPGLTDQNIEAIEQQIGAGPVNLMQTVARKGITGATVTHTKVAPTVTSGALVAANEKRVRVILFNNGGVTVYINGGAAATINDYPLSPGGGYVDAETTVAWNAITASGTGDIRVMEIALP